MERTLSAPLHIDFAITGRCQLRCNYCSAMPLGQPDVSTPRALELLKEMRDIGVFSLLVSGGEPTIHHDFLEIAAAASSAVASVLINSNGLMLAKGRAAADLHAAAPSAIIAISVDSPDAFTNDVNRGLGGDAALCAIENCLREGMVVCISSVLTEATIGSAGGLINRFFPAVKKFRFFPRVPRNSADAQRNMGNYALSVNSFYRSLKELAERFPGVEIFTPMGNLGSGPIRVASEQRCVCAETRLYIDSELNVFPCYYSANEQNKLGSCADRRLKEVWTSPLAGILRTRAASENLCGPVDTLQAIPARYKSFTIERAM